MEHQTSMYSERTWAPPWVWVLLWGACLLGAGAAVYDAYQQTVPGAALGDEPLSTLGLGLIAGGVLLFPILITAFFLRLDVEVRADHLFVAFGPLHLIRKRVRFVDIEAVRGVTYRPLREFGGWGVRWRGKKTAWTIRGNSAVRVTLRSGREVYVGSRRAQRLAGRIEVAMRRAG